MICILAKYLSIELKKKKLLITKQGCKETFVKEQIHRAKLRSRNEKLFMIMYK